MMGWVFVWYPQKIKYRFFVSFLFFILLPAAIFVMYYFRELETTLKDKINSQSAAQLGYVKESMENIRVSLFRESLVLSNDKALLAVLRDDSKDPDARRLFVTDKLQENRLLGGRSPLPTNIYYSLIDYRHQEVNSTFVSNISYYDLTSEDWWKNSEGLGKQYDQESRKKLRDVYTLTVNMIGPDNSVDGQLLISFDYIEWLKAMYRFFTIRQDYFIMDQTGNIVTKSSPDEYISIPSAEIVRRQAATGSFWTNGQEQMSAVYLPSYQWYVINSFPLHTFFGDINQVKHRLVIILTIFIFLFIAITFIISHRITRPLQLLQHHMSIVVRNEFRSSLPEKLGTGEVRELGTTFNRMISDIRNLIQKLKVEEREKEASRFQMLLAQMNPHFLLNTLNAIKWTALGRKDAEIAEICVCLGELLESSLNVQNDLILLDEELTLVKAYVRIQNFRFDGYVNVRYEYDESLRYALVPKLSLQPLVENSFFHGFNQMQKEGSITIRVVKEHKSLIMEVKDNGIGMEASANHQPSRKSKGIGINNLRERLQLLFKSDGQLEAVSSDQGTLIRLKFPLLLSEPYGKGG
ncbi:sensor histidine kinase [Paenibacillus periandrae]|uniref:sensor histidine kinase n=1 Tax=Paenibacillus periandrae TaxID=1761741 RepID=UPI001F0960E8|nr:histidine kinase [Paenibacillus periandrae]